MTDVPCPVCECDMTIMSEALSKIPEIEVLIMSCYDHGLFKVTYDTCNDRYTVFEIDELDNHEDGEEYQD